MIYSGLDDIGKAKSIAGKVIQEVCFEFILQLWESVVSVSLSDIRTFQVLDYNINSEKKYSFVS